MRSEETKDSPVLSFLVDRWWRWGGAVWRGGEELRGLRWRGGTAWWRVVGGAVVGTTGRWPVARPVKLNVTLPQTTMQLSPWRSKHREPNHFIILHGFSTVKHSYSECLYNKVSFIPKILKGILIFRYHKEWSKIDCCWLLAKSIFQSLIQTQIIKPLKLFWHWWFFSLHA